MSNQQPGIYRIGSYNVPLSGKRGFMLTSLKYHDNFIVTIVSDHACCSITKLISSPFSMRSEVIVLN